MPRRDWRGSDEGAPIVRLEHVHRVYTGGSREICALQDVCLTIDSGQFAVIMGPSGSGKSTLLNLLSAIDQPSSGDVVVAGQDLGELGEDELAAWRARHVGLVFQFFNLIPVLTALENVALPLLLTRLGRRERARRAEVALGLVGLEDRLQHRPSGMSGGEQQRVAIARAVVTDPDLIVADEPTGDLDARSAREVLDLLERLCRDLGKTIVMVTHDSRALAYADEVFHLDKGVLLTGASAQKATELLTAAGDRRRSSPGPRLVRDDERS